MYYVIYGLRILGIFPVEMDAINYKHYISDYDNRYPHTEALDVVYFKVDTHEFLEDLLMEDVA